MTPSVMANQKQASQAWEVSSSLGESSIARATGGTAVFRWKGGGHAGMLARDRFAGWRISGGFRAFRSMKTVAARGSGDVPRRPHIEPTLVETMDSC